MLTCYYINGKIVQLYNKMWKVGWNLLNYNKTNRT